MIRLLLIALAILIAPAGWAGDGDSLSERADRVVARVVAGDGVRRVALLHRAGAPGRAGRDAVTAALRARGLGLVAVASHGGSRGGVRRALARIRPAAPGALIVVGAPGPDALSGALASAAARMAHLRTP